MRHRALGVFVMFLLAGTAAARTLHVRPAGSDRADGLSSAGAFATVQRAVDAAGPGDEVVIAPGVYFETIRFQGRAGTPHQPIVFRADRVERGRVVLTRADPAFRKGAVPWTLVDATLNIYSAPFAGPDPARLLYSGTDLYPYASLEHLKAFTRPVRPDRANAGPNHGYHFNAAEQRLYVRLHASGRYGPVDPRKHTIALSPKDGAGWIFSEPGSAHVVIQGITFETPGESAVQTRSSHVTVQDCWFVGAPFGVFGDKERSDSVSDVVIAHCEYSADAVFADAEELLLASGEKAGDPNNLSLLWNRKSGGIFGLPADRIDYEKSLAGAIGVRWEIHHNYIHDAFEGISGEGMRWARDIRIHDNRFERIVDNAVETENHSNGVRIYRNEVIDVYEPFSYQPQDGPPWPGSIFVYQNVIASTPGYARRWRVTPHVNGAPGVFKIGISLKNWQREKVPLDLPKSPLVAPGFGVAVFNNTVHFPGHRLFTQIGSYDVPIGNVTFANNLLASSYLTAVPPRPRDMKPGHFVFRNNVVSLEQAPPASAMQAAGDAGTVLPDARAFGWRDPATLDFRLNPDSPALKAKSASLPDVPANFDVVGALQPGDTWYPLRVGPRVAAAGKAKE